MCPDHSAEGLVQGWICSSHLIDWVLQHRRKDCFRSCHGSSKSRRSLHDLPCTLLGSRLPIPNDLLLRLLVLHNCLRHVWDLPLCLACSHIFHAGRLTTLYYHCWYSSIGWDARALPPDISLWRAHLHERSRRFPWTSACWICPRCCWTSNWLGQLHNCRCCRRCKWQREQTNKNVCFLGWGFRSYWRTTDKGGSCPLWGKSPFVENEIFTQIYFPDCPLHLNTAFGHFRSWPRVRLLCE